MGIARLAQSLPDRPSHSLIGFYNLLFRIRPAQLASIIKLAIGVRRIRYKVPNGLVYWIDPVSVFGLHLLNEGVHEVILTQIVESILRSTDTFVDVGANEGYFSILAAQLVREGKVISIEPQTRLQAILNENIRLNAVGHVVVHKVAVSDKEGETDLYLRPSTNTGASSLFRHWKVGAAKERIRTTTLDVLLGEGNLSRVRMLKVDCEGSEALVIAGGRDVLQARFIEFIDLEYHPSICGTEVCLDIHRQLKEFGYLLTKIGDHNVYHLPDLYMQFLTFPGAQIDCDLNA
jgi:FkbM family methyltransferase